MNCPHPEEYLRHDRAYQGTPSRNMERATARDVQRRAGSPVTDS
jgi:hypothetical protein